MVTNQQNNLPSPSFPSHHEHFTSDSTDERKKWMIYQIEKTLDAFHNGLNANKEKFSNFTNNYLSKLAAIRNTILSIVGLIISVIVVLSAIGYGDEFRFLLKVTLIADIFGGTMTYLIVNYIIRKSSKKLLEIEKSYIEGYTVQNFINGFLSWIALRLGSITTDQLYNLYLYFIVVQGGIALKIVSEYEKIYPKERYPQYYEGMSPKLYSILMDNAYDIYNCFKDEFRKEQFLNIFKENRASEELLQFQAFIQPLIKNYEST